VHKTLHILLENSKRFLWGGAQSTPSGEGDTPYPFVALGHSTLSFFSQFALRFKCHYYWSTDNLVLQRISRSGNNLSYYFCIYSL